MVVRQPLIVLLAIVATASVCIAIGVHSDVPMPGYFNDAKAWAASGHIEDTFTPLAYPLFVGPALRFAGVPGIIAQQVILQVALAAVCYFFLRELRLPPLWSAWGSLPVALHPDLVLSIVKIWDVQLSVFLLLLLLLLCLRVAHGTVSSLTWLFAVIGAVLAAAIFCRPNYILLAPVIFFSFHLPRGTRSFRPAVGYFSGSLAVAGIFFALLGLASHGSAFFPRNGPYNLYAGNNPRAAETLLADLNAEPSITAVYLETHAHLTNTDLYSPTIEPFYRHQSIEFVRQHPGEELKLIVIKIFTLFRPDTKVHPLLSRDGLVKAALAFPALFLLATLLLPGGPRLEVEDWLLLGAEALYIVPFLITNSDPRFRLPLDAVLLLHTVRILYRRFHRTPFAA